MANNKDDIQIKVSVDTSDAKKELKDFEKSSDKMAKSVIKDTNEMNKAQEQLEQELKKVNTSMKDAFKNVNINGLTKAMKNVQNTVSKTVSNVKNQLQKALNIKANVDINTNTTTSKSDGANNNVQTTSMLGSTLTSGAMGASIAREMAQIRDAILQTTKESGTSFNALSSNMKTKIIDAVVTSRKAIEEMEAEFNQLKVEGLEFDPKDALIGEIDNITEEIKYCEKEINALQYEINDCFQHIEDGIEYSNSSPQEVIEDLKAQQEEYRKTQEALFQYQNQLKMFMTIGGMDGLTDDIEQLAKAFSEVKSKANLEPLVEKLKEFRQVLANAGVDVTVFDEAISKCESSMQKTGKVTQETVEAVGRVTTEVRTFKKASNEVVDSMNKVERNAKELANANLLAKPFIQAKQAIPGMARLYDNITSSLKRLVAGYKSVAKGTEQLSKANKNLSTSFKSLVSSMAPYLSIAVIFGTLKSSITSYTDSLQDSNKFSLVFGNQTQNMTDWLNNLNSTVTTSKSTLMDFSSNLFRMSRNMGATTDDSIAMAKSMTELGADLVAFTNDANSIEALAGALRGEYDSLQNYGYALDAASVEAEAMALGLDTASESALLFARQSLILKQSGDVLGYGAMQAKTLGGQLAMLQKNFQALGQAIGSCFAGLLQVVLPVLNSIVVAVTNAFNKIASVINSIFGLFGIKVGGGGGGSSSLGGGAIGDAIGGITDSLGSGLSDAVGGASGVADNLRDGASAAKEIQKHLLGIDQINNLSTDSASGSGSGSGGSGGSGSGGSGAGAGGGLLGGVADSAQEAGDKSKTIFGEIEQWIKDLANAMKEVWNTLKDGWNSVSGYITQSVANLKQAFSNLGTAIKNFLVGAWKNGGEELVYNFGRLAGAIVGCAIDIAGQVVQAFANLFNYLNPETNSITRGFLTALNRMLVASQNFALSLGNWFSIFMSSGGQAFLNVLGDIVLLIGTILANVLADGITLVTNFFNSWAGHAVIKTVAITLDVLAGVVKAALIVIDKCRYAIYGLILMFGAFKLSKIINDFNTFQLSMIKSKDTVLTFGQKLAFAQVQFAGFKTAMVNTLSSFKTFIVNGLKSAIKFTIDLGKGVVDLVKHFKALATQLVSKAIAGIKKVFNDPIGTVKALGTAIATSTKNAIAFGKAMLTNALNGLKGLATQCYAGIASLLGLSAAEGTATAQAVLLQAVLSALGIGLIVGAILGLIAVIKNWSSITAKIKELWQKFMGFLGEKCPWLKGIFEALGNVFSWIGEKVGWLWDKVKGFFGWSGENNPEGMAEDTDLAMEGLGDTAEETSDRFGTSCSKINESLASIGIDSNKLALQLDEAEAMFNEKFGMISANAKEYLDAVTSGNEDMLSQMAGDADKYLAEIKSAFEDMSVQEQAVFYATYGEINGVTDGWLDYTTGSYEDCLIKHTAMLEQINNNEKLTYDEKKARIEEETQNFVNAQGEKLKQLNLTIAEMESAEYQSEEDRYNALRGYYDQRDQLVKDMENYQLGSIDTVDEAVKQSADTQSQAYDGVSTAQQDALKEVDSSLETTKGNLSSFKEESDKVASEIPKAWSGVGKTISDEFTNAKNDVIKCFNDMNKSIQTISKTLKTNLASAFKDITTNAKTNTTKMSKDVQNAFKSMCDSIKKQFNDLSNSMKNSFQNISNTINKAFSDISTKVVSALNNMKTQAISCLKSLETSFGSSMDKIKNVAETKMKSACDGMVNKVNESRTSIVNSFNSITTGINSSLDNLNRQVGTRMDKVLSTIRYYCRYMQDATNFTFKTPYMKMPHIQVYGNWDFEKKTVPSFRVQWWSSGAVFNKRTILGGMGVGDAQNGIGNNPEAVLPLDALWSELGKQFDKQNRALSKGNNQQPIQVQVVLDGKVVAQSTIKEFKDQSRRGVLDTSWL